MSIVNLSRPAKTDEIVAELDRRGSVIEALETERDHYKDALEDIDSIAVDFGFYESAARTMQEHARTALSAKAFVKNRFSDLLHTAIELRGVCLFDDEDGHIGISEDVHIPADLFERLCSAISKATSQDG